MIQLREKHLRSIPVAVHIGMGLCMCACMQFKWKQRRKPPWPHTTWWTWSDNHDAETSITITKTSSLAAERCAFRHIIKFSNKKEEKWIFKVSASACDCWDSLGAPVECSGLGQIGSGKTDW